MSKQNQTDELDMLLEEEFIKETEMIEKSILALEDEVEENFSMSDDEVHHSYNALIERLKADGIYHEEETPAEKESDSTEIKAESLGKIVHITDHTPKKTAKRSFLRRAGKVAGIVILCFASVFAGSMTSEANRKNFIKSVQYFTGNDTRINVGSEGDENEGESELEVYEKIYDKLGIKCPVWAYYPKGFQFWQYDIYEEAGAACVEYKYEDKIITLQMQNAEKGIGGTFSLYDYGGDIIHINNNMIKEITIIETRDDGTLLDYAAQWKVKEVFFQLSGELKKEELIKIVENLKY